MIVKGKCLTAAGFNRALRPFAEALVHTLETPEMVLHNTTVYV